MARSYRSGISILGIMVFMIGAFASTAMAAEPAAPATAPDTFVGSAKCKMCHLPQFKQFDAFVADTTSTVAMNLKPCVTTDSKEVGHADAANLTIRGKLSCETCHGMGSRHVGLGAANKDSVARRATINLNSGNTCRTCHSPHALKGN